MQTHGTGGNPFGCLPDTQGCFQSISLPDSATSRDRVLVWSDGLGARRSCQIVDVGCPCSVSTLTLVFGDAVSDLNTKHGTSDHGCHVRAGVRHRWKNHEHSRHSLRANHRDPSASILTVPVAGKEGGYRPIWGSWKSASYSVLQWGTFLSE